MLRKFGFKCNFTHFSFTSICLANHLGDIQQEHLEKEAQSAACDLVGSSTNGITQFAPHRQTISMGLWLEDGQKGGDM